MKALMAVGQVLTMSSREIADLTGKDLSHVNRDIRAMLDALVDDPELDHVREDKDARGYTTAFHLGRELTYTLMAGYSVQLRRKVIARWQELEAQQAPKVPDLSTDVGKLLLIQDLTAKQLALIESNKQREAERDEAKRTKAEIGSRREATAMATAAAKSKEVERLKHELGRNQQHATVVAVEKATGRKFAKNAYVALRRVTKKYGLEAVSVMDPRWGTTKAWPAIAWHEAFGIDLPDLFPGAEAA